MKWQNGTLWSFCSRRQWSPFFTKNIIYSGAVQSKRISRQEALKGCLEKNFLATPLQSQDEGDHVEKKGDQMTFSVCTAAAAWGKPGGRNIGNCIIMMWASSPTCNCLWHSHDPQNDTIWCFLLGLFFHISFMKRKSFHPPSSLVPPSLLHRPLRTTARSIPRHHSWALTPRSEDADLLIITQPLV